MNSRQIMNALKVQLETLALPKAWPNQDFDPKVPGNLPYLSVSLLRTGTDDATLAGVAEVLTGRLVVTVVTARGSADGVADDHADMIRALFPRGTRIPATAMTITIAAPPHVREGMADAAYWRVPVIIPWMAS